MRVIKFIPDVCKLDGYAFAYLFTKDQVNRFKLIVYNIQQEFTGCFIENVLVNVYRKRGIPLAVGHSLAIPFPPELIFDQVKPFSKWINTRLQHEGRGVLLNGGWVISFEGGWKTHRR